ncbi:GreA/GreB family elongation factor [Galbibacter sp.]|uniref:GreA/GreB family elongation factor n=1 Tax=Galbibacter sp. TaxID=2918471 RepID=UPI003A910856
MRMTYQVPIVEKREYVLLKRLISLSHFHFDKRQAAEVRKLSDLLKNAKVLDEEDMPENIVRLYTTVTVSRFESEDIQFQIVLPDAANSNKRLKSIISPLGVACFGLGLGVALQIPTTDGTVKAYTILGVKQSHTAKNSISVNYNID